MCSRNKKCLNDDAPGRRTCNKCRSRKSRANNPLKATFYQLKTNAKRRCISFELTLDDWKEFCDRTSYLQFRGVLKDDFSVDRINPLVGYRLDNLQILTISENSKKARRGDKLRAYRAPTKEEAGTPF